MDRGGMRTSIILALIIIGIQTCHAWGPVGHEVVAYIAEDNLSPSAKNKIGQILGPNTSLADVANWADEIRRSHSNTAPWHFIDIPDRQAVTEVDESRFCPNGNCVVDQISAEIALLKSPSQNPKKKLEALKFLIHFMGDLHQPLHCADDGDRGGNEKEVRYRTPGSRSVKGRKVKLHALWDHLIEVKTKEDPRELATKLEGQITSAEKKKWQTGATADWAWESYMIAKKDIYSEFSAGPTQDPDGIQLPKDYYSTKMRGIVDVQLEKGGVRLANVLEGIFGK